MAAHVRQVLLQSRALLTALIFCRRRRGITLQRPVSTFPGEGELEEDGKALLTSVVTVTGDDEASNDLEEGSTFEHTCENSELCKADNAEICRGETAEVCDVVAEVEHPAETAAGENRNELLSAASQILELTDLPGDSMRVQAASHFLEGLQHILEAEGITSTEVDVRRCRLEVNGALAVIFDPRSCFKCKWFGRFACWKELTESTTMLELIQSTRRLLPFPPPSEALQALQQEVQVQLQVWESQELLQRGLGKLSGSADGELRRWLRAELEGLLGAWGTDDRSEDRLRSLLQRSDVANLLSTATQEAATELLRAEAGWRKCQSKRLELGQRLKALAEVQPGARELPDSHEGLELIHESFLEGHPLLEYSARRALELPMLAHPSRLASFCKLADADPFCNDHSSFDGREVSQDASSLRRAA